jgi:2-dehydro-3-deoxyphosphogluconate aldolase/(4S)-4-hydroxy-2-oxoglutarate aldolase
MNHLLTQLKQHRLVPVVAIDSADDALPLAEALAAGGLPVAEITFRTSAAEQSIRAIAKSGNMLVGAGTVLNLDTAKRAIDAGASFLVTPGFSHKIVEFCLSAGTPVIPGTGNATDLQAASEYGLTAVKFFPAEAIGGLKVLKALAAPFGGLKYMPTGGITADNLRAYLEFPPVLACGGSWMVARETIAAKQFDTIRTLTAQAVALVKAVGYKE